MSRWHRFDGIPDLPENAFQHCGDRRIKPQGGGGGGSQYYANLDRLYGMQADQSQQLMDLANTSVYPAFNELGNEARNTGSQANRENAASVAAADSAAARGQSRNELIDTMASFGINPGDATFQRNLARNDIAGAAADAAGRTGARTQQDQLGFARLKDFSSLGMGVPSAATDAANSAGSSAGRAGSMYQAQQQANAQSMGSAVRGGIDLYGMFKADGGLIEPLRLKGGGYVQRLAGGGVVGTMRNIQPPSPPPSTPASASASNQVVGAAAPVVGKYGQSAVNSMAGNGASQYSLSSGASGAPGLTAQQVATQQVDGVIGGVGTSNAAAGGTNYALSSGATAAEGMGGGTGLTAGGAAAAEGMGGGAGLTAAVGEGAAAGAAGSGAMAALGTAMPYIGAAMLVGSALGLFKDGGHVTPGSNGAKGGKVAGPGGPKDDLVPAMLSDGEFVMPVGAVKKFGLDRLEKMRQAGLNFEKQLGIAR